MCGIKLAPREMFRSRFHRFLFYLFLGCVMIWIIFSVYYRTRITHQSGTASSTITRGFIPKIPSRGIILKESSPLIPTKDISKGNEISLPELSHLRSTLTKPPIINPSNQLPPLETPSHPSPPTHSSSSPSLDSDEKIHSIFSTDCSPFQDWQTLLLFHSAKVVKQKGPITRIASGCTEEKKMKLIQLYHDLHPEYHVHFTPDFSIDQKTKKRYEFYNKPYGLLHWLENANPPIPPNTIIALLDPDFIFIRPLTTKISLSDILFSSPVQEQDIIFFSHIQKGKPVAQQYLLGAPWATNSRQQKSLNRTKICGENSPCLHVPNPEIGSKEYSVGAPYLLEKDDMLAVAKSWVEFVPKVYEDYPDLLAEMFAYCMAAAHQKLPHLRLDHFMVSNINADGEGWKWIDQLHDRVTEPPIDGIYFPNHSLPVFVHYCQFFRSAEYGFHKRRVYGDIFSCHRPMLLDLPADGRLAKVNYKDRDGEVRDLLF
jgi:peptidyl serine alpha-galactosyltransferase